MPYAVTLRLNPDIVAGVEGLTRRIAERGGDVAWRDYAPHITLAILSGISPPEALSNAVFGMAASWSNLPIVLAGIGIFPGDPPIIWAVPIVTERPIAMHRALHAVLDPAAAHPHYLPGAWVPHVTLARRHRCELPRVVDDLLLAWREPIRGTADRVDLVAFPPAKVLRSVALPPPDSSSSG
jgi:2'-5' RNA ligase